MARVESEGKVFDKIARFLRTELFPCGDHGFNSKYADLRGSFCNHVNFFASHRTAEGWLARNPGAATLSLDDAFALGRIRNDAGFGLVLTDHDGRLDGEPAMLTPGWEST